MRSSRRTEEQFPFFKCASSSKCKSHRPIATWAPGWVHAGDDVIILPHYCNYYLFLICCQTTPQVFQKSTWRKSKMIWSSKSKERIHMHFNSQKPHGDYSQTIEEFPPPSVTLVGNQGICLPRVLKPVCLWPLVDWSDIGGPSLCVLQAAQGTVFKCRKSLTLKNSFQWHKFNTNPRSECTSGLQ